MSLSKNIKHCRLRIVMPLRQCYSSGSNAIESPKMQAKTSTMALNQWKVLGQIKDYLSKFSSDKTFQNAFNKEFAQLLQKMQPSIYGSEIVRNFDSSVVDTKAVIKSEAKAETESSAINLPNVLNGLIKRKEEPIKEGTPQWKTASTTVSKTSISSRTRQIIYSIATAENDLAKLRKIEELSSHIMTYPEAKNNAVKDGAIRLLLQIREKTKNMELLGAIGEAFAILGYNNPLPARGIRILSIDGGGVRGILVIEMLKKLEELTGKRVHEMFDYICGVSTGAILACTLGLQRSLEDLSNDYKELSTKVFTQSAIWGTSSLVWSHSYYDTALWEKLLKQSLGEHILIKTARDPKVPKLAAVSAVVNQSRVSAFVFRNYSLPWRVQSEYMGSSDYKVWQAVRASAAAPTYFEEFKLGNLLHQDGGILVNNPTAVAIHEAKLLWPESPIQCVVSFGTGRTVSSPHENLCEPTTNSSSWKTKFMKILDSATDTEGVHTMLNDLLPGNVYYRFNPYLTEMLTMVEINPKKLEQLEMDAIMYLRRNEDKFQEAAKTLNKERLPTQKALDWINLKKELYGITSK